MTALDTFIPISSKSVLPDNNLQPLCIDSYFMVSLHLVHSHPFASICAAHAVLLRSRRLDRSHVGGHGKLASDKTFMFILYITITYYVTNLVLPFTPSSFLPFDHVHEASIQARTGENPLYSPRTILTAV